MNRISGPTSPHPATMDVDTSEDDVRVLPHQVPHQVPQQVTQQVTQQVPPLVRYVIQANKVDLCSN